MTPDGDPLTAVERYWIANRKQLMLDIITEWNASDRGRAERERWEKDPRRK